LFNKTPKYWLSICIVVFGAYVISACTESNYQGEYTADIKDESSANNNESVLTEYIIVLEENVSIASAINSLQKYELQVIKDLKKNRYLVELKNDPGIEQLQKDVEGSERIKHIQPNFTYTIQ
jgi:hypothetical protein